MAPTMISDMRTRNLLVGVILGLLAIVHSSPINSVTQIPIKVEDEVLREAETDGFLIGHFFQPSLTTESPKKNVTVQVSTTSLQSTTQEANKEMATPTSPERISVSHTAEPTSSSTDVHDAGSGSGDGTETSTAPSTSTAAHITHTTPQLLETEELGSGTEYSTTPSATTGVAMLIDTEGSGATEGPSTTSSATTGVAIFIDTEGSGSSPEPSTTSSATRGVAMFTDTEGSGSSEGTSTVLSSSPTTTTTTLIHARKVHNNMMLAEKVTATPENANHQTTLTTTTPPTNLAQQGKDIQEPGNRTPGWLIIAAFVVGVAALVLLCVAIATREKWNGPRQSSQVETENGTLSQQREVEMETFLHKEEPRENGKGAEGYTVIPLDELPENYSMQ